MAQLDVATALIWLFETAGLFILLSSVYTLLTGRVFPRVGRLKEIRTHAAARLIGLSGIVTALLVLLSARGLGLLNRGMEPYPAWTELIVVPLASIAIFALDRWAFRLDRKHSSFM